MALKMKSPKMLSRNYCRRSTSLTILHSFLSLRCTIRSKVHYPIFGEFLDAISSSVSEASFYGMRNSIVRQIIEQRAAQTSVAMETMLVKQVAGQINTLHFDFTHFDSHWAKLTRTEIDHYTEEIRSASSRLETVAAKEQREQTRAAAGLTMEQVELMRQVSAVDRRTSFPRR